MAEKDKGEDENQHLRNRIAVLEAKLEHWQKFARTLCDLLRRVGSERMSPEDARVRLQAAVENRLVVAPVTVGAKDDERNRLARIEDAQNAVRARDLPRAIEIYAELCEQYPDETRFRLKLGDCYARTGNVEKATATYLTVARKYEEQGFFLKAAAVYKQILKMGTWHGDGADLAQATIADVHHALASMYVRLGLLVDARTQYEEFYRLAEEGDARLAHAGEEIARGGGNPQGLRD